jgi:hypothetical protein
MCRSRWSKLAEATNGRAAKIWDRFWYSRTELIHGSQNYQWRSQAPTKPPLISPAPRCRPTRWTMAMSC